MALESPLFLTKVECPVCGTINEHETIRVGAYTEGERETDFCPSVIKWRNPKYQRYHPLLFFTATCSHCFFTREFNNRFKEWKKDNNFRAYRQKPIKENHLGQLAMEHSFIKLVGELLDNEQYPDETAILKLILAIYDELLLDHPSHLDLGRFYLRIAWLFRQYGGGVEGGAPMTAMPKSLRDIERAVADLQTWSAGLGRNVDYLREAVAAYFTQTPEDADDPADEDAAHGKYIESLGRLEQVGNDCTSIMTDLETALASTHPAAEGPGIAAGEGPFYNHDSFGDFLVGLSRTWDGVPRSETDALRFSVRHYIKSFELGKEIGRGNQSIQAAYLIAELSRRIGDYDVARQYFNTTIKMGQEYINEIRGDRTRTALTRKLLEMALAQGKKNLAEAKEA